MSREGKLGVVLVALVAVGLAGWALSSRSSPGISSEPVTDRTPLAASPTLHADVPPHPDPAVAPAVPSRPIETPSAPAPTTAPILIEDLISSIKQEVEPSSWLGPNAGQIRVQGSALVVRAEPGVLTLLGEYLEDRRHAIQGSSPSGTEVEPVDRGAAREEVRAILRRLLAQGLRLSEACDAIRAGDRDRAAGLVKEAMEAEPGNAAGTWIQKALDAGPPENPCSNISTPWSAPMTDWARQWGSAETAAALAASAERAGLRALSVRGAERDLLLQRGAVSLRVGSLKVGEAVARLSVESQTAVMLDPRVAADIRGISLGAVDIRDRPLSQILDQIVESLPGCVWRMTALRIVITRPDYPENRVTQIFSVADILAGDASVDATIHLVEPPQYRSDASGAPVQVPPSTGAPSPPAK